MSPVLPLLLMVLGVAPALDRHDLAGRQVFRALFDESSDENYDRWPDGWTRRHGPGFPRYVRLEICEEPSPAGGRCLRIDLDGGGAIAYSPPIPVSPLSAYVLEVCVKTEDLRHDRAYLSLTLLDSAKQTIRTQCSERIQTAEGWRRLRIGPIVPDAKAQTALVGLHLEPQGTEEDLQGAALFGDVWLARLPRLTLTAGCGAGASPGGHGGDRSIARFNVFSDPREIEITCTASGFEGQSEIVFQLEDIGERQLAQTSEAVRKPPNIDPLSLRERAEARERADQSDFSASSTWKPPVPGPGFYRVRAAMMRRGEIQCNAELTLVVIEPCRAPVGSEFGWSLPQGDRPASLPQLAELLTQAGIRWVKYPLWYPQHNGGPWLQSVVAFSDRLVDPGIALVGILAGPTGAGSREDRGLAGEPRTGPVSPAAADVFAPDAKVWYPSLEPLMARLGTQIRWWQVGEDRDTSFVGSGQAAEKITQIKAALDRIGQDVGVGTAWIWGTPLPKPSEGKVKTPWRFLTFSAEPSLGEQDLAGRLDAAKGLGVGRWVALEALPKDAACAEPRAEDLAKRMIAAKIHGAEAIFYADPFDSRRGLLTDDGTANELLLPWRTTALALGGASYLGGIELPGGSATHVFARRADILMTLWNDRPVQETVFLGEKIRQTDLWGRGTEVLATASAAGNAASIRVDRLPTFLTGLREPIVQWQLAAVLGHNQMPSIADEPHANSLRLKNSFAQTVSGRAILIAPQGWRIEPKIIPFRLAKDQQQDQPFEITLPNNVLAERQQIRVDFEIEADQQYRFSVYRTVDVGLGDVLVNLSTRLNKQGDLEVEQTLSNQGDRPASFQCQLLVPDRRRMATQVLGLQRGRDVKVYRVPDGKDLLGKTLWLRAEELDGPRVLNYRLAVAGDGTKD